MFQLACFALTEALQRGLRPRLGGLQNHEWGAIGACNIASHAPPNCSRKRSRGAVAEEERWREEECCGDVAPMMTSSCGISQQLFLVLLLACAAPSWTDFTTSAWPGRGGSIHRLMRGASASTTSICLASPSHQHTTAPPRGLAYNGGIGALHHAFARHLAWSPAARATAPRRYGCLVLAVRSLRQQRSGGSSSSRSQQTFPSTLVCLRVRKDKRPQDDGEFLMPRTDFESRWMQQDFGTFEAEMVALDRMEEDSEGFVVERDRFDEMGDVRAGIPFQNGVIGMGVDRPKFNNKSIAAKKRWEDEEYREKMLRQRQEKARARKAEKDELNASKARVEDGDSPAPASDEKRAAKQKSIQAAVEKRRKMRQDPNGWMKERLESDKPLRGTLEWRMRRKQTYSESALKRQGRPKAAVRVMRATLDSIGLDQWGGLLEMSECADVVKVSAMSLADLVAIGIPQDASRAILEASTKEVQAALLNKEQQKANAREYMKAYRMRKAAESGGGVE